MALDLKLSNEAVNAAADARCALLNNGYLRYYDGTKPATANTAIGAQVMLAELRFSATAFAPAVAGVAVANPIASDPDAAATGNASWYRTFKSDGVSPISDGTIGTSGCNLNVVTTAITQGAPVDCTAFSFTQPKA